MLYEDTLDEAYVDDDLDEVGILDELYGDEEREDLYEQLVEAIETLGSETSGMTVEEAEDYITSEWVQALIPIVTALAPAAARAIGSLVNRNRNRSRPNRRRRPRARPTPAPRPPANANPTVAGFLQLLQNPQVIQAIGRALTAARTESVYDEGYDPPEEECGC